MKLRDCTHGKIVCLRDSDKKVIKVGMIVGITSVYTDPPRDPSCLPENAIPLVQWSGHYSPCGVHYSNLQEFDDY